MIPDDHPHGGGRGKSKGNRPPTSPWGTLVRLFPCPCGVSCAEADYAKGQKRLQDEKEDQHQQDGGHSSAAGRSRQECQGLEEDAGREVIEAPLPCISVRTTIVYGTRPCTHSPNITPVKCSRFHTSSHLVVVVPPSRGRDFRLNGDSICRTQENRCLGVTCRS